MANKASSSRAFTAGNANAAGVTRAFNPRTILDAGIKVASEVPHAVGLIAEATGRLGKIAERASILASNVDQDLSRISGSVPSAGAGAEPSNRDTASHQVGSLFSTISTIEDILSLLESHSQRLAQL